MNQDDYKTAENWFKKELKITRQLVEESPTFQTRSDLLNTYINLGNLAKNMRDLDAAQQWYQQAREVEIQLSKNANNSTAKHKL